VERESIEEGEEIEAGWKSRDGGIGAGERERWSPRRNSCEQRRRWRIAGLAEQEGERMRVFEERKRENEGIRREV
jgi:hypothetical protein